MSSFWDFLQMGMMCFTILMVAFFVVLALPQSRMRDVIKHAMTAVICVFYVISPVDFLPEIGLGPLGLIDDLGAVMMGIVSAKKAVSMGKPGVTNE